MQAGLGETWQDCSLQSNYCGPMDSIATGPILCHVGRKLAWSAPDSISKRKVATLADFIDLNLMYLSGFHFPLKRYRGICQ